MASKKYHHFLRRLQPDTARARAKERERESVLGKVMVALVALVALQAVAKAKVVVARAKAGAKARVVVEEGSKANERNGKGFSWLMFV